MKKIEYFIKKYLENRPMFMAIIRSQEATLFQKYKKLVKGKILDFGCGDGFFTKITFSGLHVFTRKKNHRIYTDFIGIDLNTNQRVKEARKNKFYKKIVLYGGHKIPYPAHYFQTVISNCVLEHIPNLNNSLKEISRVLKPGGYFLTSVMTDQWEHNLFGSKIFGKVYPNYMRRTQVHYNLFSNKKWQTHFKIVGFNIQSVNGYLYQKSTFFLDLFHYLSIGSLINYKLFKKWVLFSIPILINFKALLIKKIINKDNNSDKASALFFVLKK